jgi:hypothetical protein
VLKKSLFLAAAMLVISGLAWAAVQLPEQFKDIPVFSGSKITQAMEMENTATATFTVKAESDAVLDFYRQSMKSKGWKVVFQAEQEDSAIISFSGGKQTLQLNVHKQDDGIVQFMMVLSTASD